VIEILAWIGFAWMMLVLALIFGVAGFELWRKTDVFGGSGRLETPSGYNSSRDRDRTELRSNL
jgi:hypothetical protein